MSAILKPKTKNEIADLKKRGFREKNSRWKFNIYVYDLLLKYEKNTDIVEFKNTLIERLKDVKKDIFSVIKNDYQGEYEKVIAAFETCKNTPKDIDDVLSGFFDWADNSDVWIESTQKLNI